MDLEILPPPYNYILVLVTITYHVILRDFFFQSDWKAPSIAAQLIYQITFCETAKTHSTFRINGRIFLNTMKV